MEDLLHESPKDLRLRTLEDGEILRLVTLIFLIK